MGFTYYDTGDRPAPFDIVWCKWPQRGEGLKPGPVRPVLVLDSSIYSDPQQKTHFAGIICQYGGDFTDAHLNRNLHIGEREYRVAGLHKPTVFRLDLGNRKILPWCEEYFVSQGYQRDQGILIGRLNGTQKARVIECLGSRNLSYPVPIPGL